MIFKYGVMMNYALITHIYFTLLALFYRFIFIILSMRAKMFFDFCIKH